MDYTKIMDIDPIDMAEKSGMNPFTVLQMKSKAETLCAKDLQDTYFNMSWKELVDLINGNSHIFKFEVKFEHTRKNDNGEEQEILWWDAEHFLLIYAESYHGRVNNCHCYGNCLVKDWDVMSSALSHCSHGPTIDRENKQSKCCVWNYDGRTFLFSKITQITMTCGNCAWEKMPFLWLLNYDDTKIKNYNYTEINRSKLGSWFQFLNLFEEEFHDSI